MDREKKECAGILADTMKRIYEDGLTTMSGGNLSLKDEEGRIWVTPSGVDKGGLTAEDIMCVNLDGTVEGRTRVTSEFVVHQAILEKRPDKKAVLHAHSPIVLGFSTARFKPDESLFADCCNVMGGRVNISPYQRAGSPKLAEETAKHLARDEVATILENHGLFMVGDSMKECYANLELLELAGSIELQAHMLQAKTRSLSEEQRSLLRQKETDYPEETAEMTRTDEDERLAETICRLMKRMYSRKINTSTTGSFSVRTDDGSILITPMFEDVRDLIPSDIVKVRGNQCEAGKRPGGAYRLHQKIYEQNPGVTTIITAVPKYLMTYAVTDAVFLSEPVWEAYYLLRDVPKIPLGRGEKFRETVASAFGERVPTLLVENDCYIATSHDIMDAYDKVEVAEATAKGTIKTSVIAPPAVVEKEIIQMYDGLINKMLFGRE